MGRAADLGSCILLGMNSADLARYLEQTDSAHKPWLLVQLRLLKLHEERPLLSEGEYQQRLADIHTALMALGEWWLGREAEMF